MRCLIFIIYDQSEREHQTSKGRHARTNGRSIPQQLSKIEQRQRRIRMIRENLNGSHLQRDLEHIVVDPNTRYNMGTSQNFPVHIPTFLQRNEGDPAIKVRMLISSSS
jgi:phosphopantetheine adenylyltransferase